jgi:hypothetical protein
MRLNPWDLGRLPLAEDERPYGDAKRPEVTVPPVRFREQDAIAEGRFFHRLRELRKKYAPPKAEENGRLPPGFGGVKVEAPSWQGGAAPAREHPLAPQGVPASAFDRLPPEAQAGIIAGAAKAVGAPGAATLYEAPDGQVLQLPEDMVINATLLESMQVSAEPYSFDDWIGFALNLRGAFRAMLVVCTCLNAGKEVPPVGGELTWDPEEAPAACPPGSGTAASPPTSGAPSPPNTPTPTPSSTSAPRSAALQEQIDRLRSSSEPMPIYSETTPESRPPAG